VREGCSDPRSTGKKRLVPAGRWNNKFVRPRSLASSSDPQVPRDGWRDADGVKFAQPLQGTQLEAKELKRREDLLCLGGQRRASASASKLPSAMLLGSKVEALCLEVSGRTDRCRVGVPGCSWPQRERCVGTGRVSIPWEACGSVEVRGPQSCTWTVVHFTSQGRSGVVLKLTS